MKSFVIFLFALCLISGAKISAQEAWTGLPMSALTQEAEMSLDIPVSQCDEPLVDWSTDDWAADAEKLIHAKVEDIAKIQAGIMMSGKPGYRIGNDIRTSPRFRIDLYIDIPDGYQVNKLTFDVAYSCSTSFGSLAPEYACRPDFKLPFIMATDGDEKRGQGTRYPDKSYNAGDPTFPEPLDAQYKWWTFVNKVKDLASEKVTNVTFLVGRGAPVTWHQKFNMLQLYFEFTKSNFKTGDVFVIYLNNIHVYQGTGVNEPYTELPSFPVFITFEDPNGVEEMTPAESLLEHDFVISPNPGSAVARIDSKGFSQAEINSIRLVNSLGVNMPVVITEQEADHCEIDLSYLSNGVYSLILGTKAKPLMVIR